MNKQFNEDELHTEEEFDINSIIMEQASDNAERLTELECKVNALQCYTTVLEKVAKGEDVEVSSFTNEAQDIFNIIYDKQMNELYDLLNLQLKIIK